MDELEGRRVAAAVTYLAPFRIVESVEKGAWSASIDQINSRSWDYIGLHELIGGLDVGLPAPFHMVVARDGALALPPLEHLRSDQKLVAFYNECLAALLIGGVYCESISSDGLGFGSIIDWKYIRVSKSGLSGSNQFHNRIRLQSASSLEAIFLHAPQTISMKMLWDAMSTGRAILSRVGEMRGEFLLRGATGLARRDWGIALSNLWIVVEQVLSHLWEHHVVIPTRLIDDSKSRKDQLEDTRTWTASARIEMLFQKNVLDAILVSQLAQARKARNLLSHRGIQATDSDAKSAFSAVLGLISTSLDGERFPLMDMDLSNHSLTDPFSSPKSPLNPTHWMEIPKLPGELELERAEAKLRGRVGDH